MVYQRWWKHIGGMLPAWWNRLLEICWRLCLPWFFLFRAIFWGFWWIGFASSFMSNLWHGTSESIVGICYTNHVKTCLSIFSCAVISFYSSSLNSSDKKVTSLATYSICTLKCLSTVGRDLPLMLVIHCN